MFEFIRNVQQSKIVDLSSKWYPILRTRYGKEYKDIDSGARKIIWESEVQDKELYDCSN